MKIYKLFTTATCPNCQNVKEFMKTVKMKGEIIDASTQKGLKEAQELGVMMVPVVVFFENAKEIGRASSLDKIKEYL